MPKYGNGPRNIKAPDHCRSELLTAREASSLLQNVGQSKSLRNTRVKSRQLTAIEIRAPDYCRSELARELLTAREQARSYGCGSVQELA